MFAAIFTGIVGAVIAMSRLIYALSIDEVFPRWQWLAKLPVYLFTAEVEMKDTYAEKGFDGILLKPANLEALRKLLP